MIAYEDHLCNWVKRSKSSCGYGDVLIPDPIARTLGENARVGSGISNDIGNDVFLVSSRRSNLRK